MTRKEYEKINTLILWYLVIVVVSAFAGAWRQYLFNSMSERIAQNLRNDYYVSLINKDIAFFDERKSGDLLSRLNSDIQIIQDSLSTNISMFLRGVLFIILVLIIMMLISPELTGVTIACIIPIVLFAVLVFARKMRILTRVQQQAKADMTNIVEESFSNIRTVKAFASEIEEIIKFNHGNKITYDIGVQKA